MVKQLLIAASRDINKNRGNKHDKGARICKNNTGFDCQQELGEPHKKAPMIRLIKRFPYYYTY